MIIEILGPMATTMEGESQEANAKTPYTIPLLMLYRCPFFYFSSILSRYLRYEAVDFENCFPFTRRDILR